ncbi:hypothetical protein BDQ12DRAFT_723961 [Crucibulum laeve]|uniref:Uncharacterized protein n=1 Tax=Crucibulum laeve TaxID=68775 RepID=A0A5C3LXE0_9AGAR|nr:hypothetical protein BDQ12DRAFT_723961 [Crucibulum laeve]
MPLNTNSLYNIRFVPNGVTNLDFVGGMYATAPSKVGESVQAEALGPSATGWQAWQVENIGGDNYFISTLAPLVFDTPTFVQGWQHNKEVCQGEPVIYGANKLSEFAITPADLPDTYHILVGSGRSEIGAQYAVAEGDTNDLVINSYPVIADLEKLLPRWQFIPVEPSQAAPTS